MEKDFDKCAEGLLSILQNEGKKEILSRAMEDPESLRPCLTETIGMGEWLDPGNKTFFAMVAEDALGRILEEERR